MPAPTSPTLDEFARLIARGFDPREACARSGYPDLRRSRARARLARPEVAARIVEIRGPSETVAAAPRRRASERPTREPEPPRFPLANLEPELTNEEWLAEYAPRSLGESGGRA